jgi:hypothetical protein
MADRIYAGEAGGADVLINDDGAVVLRDGDHSVTADPAELAAILTRVLPVCHLVARSATPISGMSAAIERSLLHYGCRRVPGPGHG